MPIPLFFTEKQLTVHLHGVGTQPRRFSLLMLSLADRMATRSLVNTVEQRSQDVIGPRDQSPLLCLQHDDNQERKTRNEQEEW